MKKLFLLTFFTLFSLCLTAQTEKGNWFFGGDTSLGFTSSNAQAENDGKDVGDKLTVSKFSFMPSANYFVMDNLSVGLGLLFESATEKEGSDEDKTSSFAALPTATYFFKSDSQIVPFVGLGAGLMSTSYGDKDENKYNGFAFGANGGIAYFISDSVSLNLGLSYLNSSLKNKKNDKYKVKSGNLGVKVGFGIFL
ncbi:MAG: outer membrane beta-barrel protein [Flavobacteriaceae bacterium]